MVEKDELHFMDQQRVLRSHKDIDQEPNPSKQLHPYQPSGGSSAAVQATENDANQHITGIKLWLLMASISLVCFLMLLDMSIIVTAIPRITSNFHSLADVGWYGSAYLLANCALQPLTGKVYTHFNTKYTFLFFLGLFEFGSVICGAATSSNMLIIGRAVAGLGGSGLMNGALTIIGAAAPIHKRPALMGIMMGIGQLGIVSGPLIGGSLTQYATWRWCFYINLPVGGVSAIFLLLIKVPNNLEKVRAGTDKITVLDILKKKLDLFGFILFAPCAVMFLLALEWGGTVYSWNSSIIIGLLCGSAATLFMFGAWEYHVGDEAMIPFSIIFKRVVLSSCLVMGFFFGGMLSYSYYLAIYFQTVREAAPTMGGVYVLPSILGQILTAVASGVFVGKVGYYLPFSVASGAITAVACGLISTFKISTATAAWVGYQILAGAGRGFGFQMPIIAVQNVLPPTQIPVGMALVVFTQTFGGAIFLTFAQMIFSKGLLDGLAQFAPSVDAHTVINAGATSIHRVVKPDQISGVLEAYNLAVNHVFYLVASASVAAFFFSWGIGWVNIKKSVVVKPEA